MTWNPDYTAEFKRRQKMLFRLEGNHKLISAYKLHYKTHPVDCIQDICMTQDPRNALDPNLLSDLPMVLWDKQKEIVDGFYDCIHAKPGTPEARIAIVKARDGGVTWLSVHFGWWGWTFYGNIVAGFGSNKAESVDKLGDPNSILEKARYQIRKTPSIFIPKGFDFKKHSKLMNIFNPENNSVIVGKAGDDIGMGGRSSWFNNDEKASYQHAEAREAALSGNTDHIIDISTPKGTGNIFHSTVRNKHNPIIWCYWYDDPRKDKEWHKNMLAEYTAKGIAHVFKEQYECDFIGSVDRVVIPYNWIEAAIDSHLALGFEGTGKIRAGQDLSDGGGDLNSLSIADGNILFFNDSYGREQGELDKTAVKTCRDCVKYKVKKLKFDVVGVGSQFKTDTDRFFNENDVVEFEVEGWNAGSSTIEPDEEYIDGFTNKDMFENAKAQAWWYLRVLFQNTYRMRNEEQEYPVEELISISSSIANLADIMEQLAQVRFQDSKAGKIMIDKTPDGTKSPDLAEGVVICFAPEETYIAPYQ